MAKVEKYIVKDKTLHWNNMTMLFELIARKHGKKHGDVVIAYEQDISVYNVRQWLTRPIPPRHWKAIAMVAGLPMRDIRDLVTSSCVKITTRATKSAGSKKSKATLGVSPADNQDGF